MSAPAPKQWIQGQGTVTADNLNTFVQTTTNLAQLRSFIGAPGMVVTPQGTTAPGDGGFGTFFWNPTSTGPDDNANTIVPYGVDEGAWIRLLGGTVPGVFASLQVSGPVTGAGFTNLFASPPPIGNVVPNFAVFTTVQIETSATAPTLAASDNSTNLATTAFVANAVQAVSGAHPGTATPLMDGTAAVGTSLLYARQDHVHPTDTTRYAASNPSGFQTAVQVSAAVGTETTRAEAAEALLAPRASPTLTGTPTAPTATTGTNTTQIATTQFVTTAVVAATTGVSSVNTRTGAVTLSLSDIPGAAPLASPPLTGTPTAPTAAAGTNTTQLATAAFVQASYAAPPALGATTPAAGTFTTLHATGLLTPSVGIKGTATNDNAAAGNVGEYISLTVPQTSTVPLTTSTPAIVGSITLTAGDWDVWGVVCYTADPSTLIVGVEAWTAATSGALPSPPNTGGVGEWFGSVVGQAPTTAVGMQRFSLAASTTVFLMTQSVFTVSTLAAFGFIGARRVR